MNYGTQLGPCVICGMRNYNPSMGGPTICPTCDCGHFGPQLVALQKGRIQQLEAMLEAAPKPIPADDFQSRVKPWMLECFGPVIPFDKTERNHRFLEEALELVQSLGCTQSEAHQLVDYVFNRPAGDPPQESGGVMVTHAALCIANNLDMMQNAETELARIWTKVEVIRAKQAAKPKHSPLPGPSEGGGK